MHTHTTTTATTTQTSDRIAVGYSTASHGSCVREMVAKYVVGAPSDVDVRIFSDSAVERRGGRTVMRFVVPQHWPHPIPNDGFFRVSWALGAVSAGSAGEGGCQATIGFHDIARGVAPLTWLKHNSRPCVFE